MFWRVDRNIDALPRGLLTAIGAEGLIGPKVVAVIPARDEAATIGTAVSSLLQQQFAGSLHLIVVDDGSSDDTPAVAIAAAARAGVASRLTVMHSSALPRGWTGKLWALSQGVQAAAALAPDYLLLTDADIEHERGNLTQLVARAEAEQRDLASCMVMLSVSSFAERCLIPAFVFFFLKLYPPRWVSSGAHSIAAAAGGCILVRPTALQRIGGLAAVRSRLIDDCALAQAVKGAGGRICVNLTRHARSLRRYGSFSEIGQMISRTAFNQLHHSYSLLAATLLGLAVTYLAPPLLLFSHDELSVALGAIAWGLMSLCYLPMVRFYGLSPFWSLCLPAVAAFYSWAATHSAIQYRRGRGGVWKGRAQDLRA